MPISISDTADYKTYSPEWWLRRLIKRLMAQSRQAEAYQAFYEGDQPLAFASKSFVEAYGRRYAGLPANFMGRVVAAEKERMAVQGFRFGAAPEADKTIWRLWQDNQLDAESQIAHEIALVKGVAFTMTVPSTDGPLITIEDPCETVLETAPGNRRIRLAALKVWLDDEGYTRAYLYLPEWIYKYRTINRRSPDYGSWSLNQAQWQPYIDEGEDFPVRNPLGVVPVVPLLNRPKRDGIGQSEIRDVIGNQNAINFLRYSALIGSDSAALPQRWARNLDLEIDPNTGKFKQPFVTGKDTLWVTRAKTSSEIEEFGGLANVPEAEFGQFPEATLEPFVRLINSELSQMATISATPHYQLLGLQFSVAPSGEAIKSAEAACVKKTRAAEIDIGEGWEETMRVAMLADGQTAKARTDGETIWADPETRNEAARTDSILKQYEAGLLPDEFAWEELGYSQQQIARLKELRAQEAAAAPAEPAIAEDATGNLSLIQGGAA